MISMWELLAAIRQPILSAIVAAALTYLVQSYCIHVQSAFLRLVLGGSCMFGFYFWMLLFIMEQKTFYIDLLRGLRRPPSIEPKESI